MFHSESSDISIAVKLRSQFKALVGEKKSISLSPMVKIRSLFVITQSDFYATFQRLQGKGICLIITHPDLGKLAPS